MSFRTLLSGLSRLCNVNLSSPLSGTGFTNASESGAVAILVSNLAYPRFYPPSVRVREIRRSPGEAVNGLLESLVQKKTLAPDEAANAMKSTSPPALVPLENS